MPQQSLNEYKIFCLLVDAANSNWTAEYPSDGSEGRCQGPSTALKHRGSLWNTDFQCSRVDTASKHHLVYNHLQVVELFWVFIPYFSWAMRVIHTNTLSLKSSVMRRQSQGRSFGHGKCLPPERRGWWRRPRGFLAVRSAAAHSAHAAETRGRAVVIDCCENRGLQSLHRAIEPTPVSWVS